MSKQDLLVLASSLSRDPHYPQPPGQGMGGGEAEKGGDADSLRQFPPLLRILSASPEEGSRNAAAIAGTILFALAACLIFAKNY